MAVVQADSNSSNSTPNLETSICHGRGPKKKKKKKREKEIDAAIRDLSEGYNITCGIDLKQK